MSPSVSPSREQHGLDSAFQSKEALIKLFLTPAAQALPLISVAHPLPEDRGLPETH